MGGAAVRRSKDPLPRARPPAIAATCWLLSLIVAGPLAAERSASDLEREEFLERGWLGHTRSLYEELVRVPLFIGARAIRPGAVSAPVSLVSITPIVAYSVCQP